MTGTIRFLKIANYRSIDVLELREIKPFSVFVGPNGAGKTNFFGALDFVNLIIRFGAEEALKKHGGFENIRCLRRRYEDASVFEFELVFELETENQQTETLTYHLEIRQLDTSHPFIEDYVLFNDKSYRKTDVMDIFRNQYLDFKEKNFYYSNNPCLPLVAPFLPHFRLYQIEPEKAKLPVKNYDDSELSHNGHNLAAVLNRLEKDDDIRETILEWMEFVIPGLERVDTQIERLTGSTVLTFKEEGIEKLLPAHLISDGTIYLLSLLVALFDRPSRGLILIEEPERGLHPKVIMELVDAFREQATFEHPIWMTTHNEALVRCLKNNELWLVDKKQGHTEMKQVPDLDKLASSVDQAWLTNTLSGGLPW